MRIKLIYYKMAIKTRSLRADRIVPTQDVHRFYRFLVGMSKNVSACLANQILKKEIEEQKRG